MATKFVELTWTEWEEKFKPIKNHITKYPTTDSDYESFETYGAEVEYVQSKIEDNLVWTFGDGDMCTYLSNGYHYVNRLNYYVCTVPYEEDVDYQIIASTEVECDCYKEEGYGPYTFPNGHEYYEDGDRACKECEGYGLRTVYND